MQLCSTETVSDPIRVSPDADLAFGASQAEMDPAERV